MSFFGHGKRNAVHFHTALSTRVHFWAYQAPVLSCCNISVQSSLGQKAKQRLQFVFNKIDTDQSGAISASEFKHACGQLSISITEEELGDFIHSDVSGDGELNFSEFCEFYVQRLQRVFQAIDSDKSGEINTTELRDAFKNLGFEATEREVQAVLAEVDRDRSESVDFEEFCNFFCSLPSPNVRSIVEQWAAGLSIDTGSDLAPPPLPPASVLIWRTLLAGGVAGVVSRTATAPLEKIKIMAQTSTTGKVRIMNTLSTVWKQERLKGLFAGNGANCLRVLPFSALVCLAYANLAKYFPLDSNSSPWNPVWRMGTGAFAGVFATVLTHPMDVIRARLTVQSQTNRQYKGMIDGLVTVAKREKLPGLYRGIGPTLLAIAPFMAVQQASYDVLKHKAMMTGVQPSAMLFLICGSIAGATAQTVVYPLEVIRRRMQVHSAGSGGQTIGLWSLAKSLTIRNLFAGLTATYVKVMPAAAISLLVRDALLGRLNKK